ncbi:MFS general substrate transporter [Metschnikowia bicuspidata]|uniref:MFS general substrate transporter n=1 Tax=Metschnikowia bicuspidata TaxID=27322 RepID=A0A4V1J2R2_9ASCO|nr:MFS general substrate transporter [Metschnikowia bicuspidata]
MSLRDQLAGFPVGQMAVISVMRFSEPLAFTSLFPYLYFMIRDFQTAPTEADISKYSGYMASSFAFCQFLFAVHWGRTSDRIGRKPVLILGLLGTSACLLVFGFSTNYYTAFAARAIAGALNGNVAVLRTTIGEVCHEKRHQALGFSTLPLLFNLGSIIGPWIGGCAYFTAPPSKSPYDRDTPDILGVEDSDFLAPFRKEHPYALSNIVVTSVLWISCIIGFLFLEETNEKFKDRRDVGIEIGDYILSKFGVKTPPRGWKRSKTDEESPLLNVPERFTAGSIDSDLVKPRAGYESPDKASSSSEDDTETIGSYKQTLLKPMVRRYSQSSSDPVKREVKLTARMCMSIASNCILSLHNMAYNEFLPVFLAAPLHKEVLKFPLKIEGGVGLTTSTIGTLFSSTGIMGMLIILFIFPWIDRNLGTLQGYKFSLTIFPLVYLLVPMAVFTTREYNANFPTWFTVFSLYLLTSLKTLAQSTGLPQAMILTHRSAEKSQRAYVNSLTLSMVALGRCLGPIAFGYIMTIGDKYQISWLSWWIMAALAFVGFIQTYFMDDSEEPNS